MRADASRFGAVSIRFIFPFMKSSFLVLALLGATSVAKAQTSSTNSTSGETGVIPAGTISLGGNIGYNRQTESQNIPGPGQVKVSRSSFQIAPAVGYFLADNLAIGLDLSYGAQRNTLDPAPQGNLNAATTLRVGPYVQYYKMLSEQFGVLGTLGGGYARNVTPRYVGPTTVVEEKTSGAYARLTPGVIFFPVPKFGISATIGFLGYDRTRPDNSSTDFKTTSFGASFGLSQLNFGGTYFFGR